MLIYRGIEVYVYILIASPNILTAIYVRRFIINIYIRMCLIRPIE